MALRNLTTAEMLTISDPWVDEEREERTLLSSAPETDVLLPHLERSHRSLLEKQPPGDSALEALNKKIVELDTRHDDLVRGVYWALTAFASLSGDAKQREELLELRDTLIPMGLSLVGSGYRDESGASILMEQRLTSEIKAALEKIKLPTGTLMDSVDELIEVGRELGHVEDRRAELRNTIDGPTGAEILAARNEWIRMTHALVASLELTSIDKAAIAKLLAPLEEAVKIADRRVAVRSGKEVSPEETTTPENPVQPPTPIDEPTPTDEPISPPTPPVTP
jgi:hypothetical protein